MRDRNDTNSRLNACISSNNCTDLTVQGYRENLQQLDTQIQNQNDLLENIRDTEAAGDEAARQQRDADLRAAEEEQMNDAKGTPASNALGKMGGFAGQIGYSKTPRSLPEIIGSIIKGLLGLAGTLLVVLIIYAGWLWMSSRGEEDKIEQSKNILKSAIIGLAIIILAFAITSFVLNQIIKPIL